MWAELSKSVRELSICILVTEINRSLMLVGSFPLYSLTYSEQFFFSWDDFNIDLRCLFQFCSAEYWMTFYPNNKVNTTFTSKPYPCHERPFVDLQINCPKTTHSRLGDKKNETVVNTQIHCKLISLQIYNSAVLLANLEISVGWIIIKKMYAFWFDFFVTLVSWEPRFG